MSQQISERQKKLVSIVSILPEKEVSLPMLQKILFLCKERIKSCDVNYTFEKSHYGPFSHEIVQDIDELQQKGIVKLGRGARVIVTCEIQDKWPNAERTVSELRSQFPNNSAIIVSALSSPNVICRAVGEPIKTSQ